MTTVTSSVSTYKYEKYDELGRVREASQTTGGVRYGMFFGYNLASGLTAVTYPSNRVVGSSYDSAGRLSGVTGYASGMLYASHNALRQGTLGNGLLQATNFDSRLQPTGIMLDRPSPFERLLSLSYSYYANGNVSNHTLIAPGLSVRSQDFSYDAYNRLKVAVENRQSGSVQCPDAVGSTWCEKYGYDQYGNRWVDQSTGLVQLPITPSAGSNFNASTNRIVGNGYDLAGNQTAAGNGAFSYDAENRQTKVVPNLVGIDPAPNTSQYYYDGEGRRVKREVFGRTRVYVYGPAGQLLAEYNNGQLWKEYVYAGGPLLALEDQNPVGRSYLTTDHLGSTRLVTNASGNVESRHDYLPFGKEIPVDLGGRNLVAGYGAQENILQRFTGKEVDPETGLQYFGARYYSGRQGRFTSPDSPFADQLREDPQSWNLYAYARNNPLKWIDETGHGAALAAVRQARRLVLKRLFATARQQATRKAWVLERELVLRTGEGTRKWTKAQMKELVETGKVSGFVGHHINSVAHNDLKMAANPNNIKFVEGQASNLAEHAGDFRNETSGPLIDRLARLGGPALLTFFLVFDEKMEQFTSSRECPFCSNPNSWLAMFNPFNNLVEGPALLEAFVEADRRERVEQEKRAKCGEDCKNCPEEN